MLTIEQLYDLNHTLAADYLRQFTYPWEALAGIKAEILRIGAALDPAEYTEVSEHVWVHKTADGCADRVSGCALHHRRADGSAALRVHPRQRAGGGRLCGRQLCGAEERHLFDDVQTPHYNYVGDSILGYSSHMGAGSITSNVKSDKTLVTVRGAGESMATGLKEMGAMLGDYVEVGCNSVLNPGTVMGRSSQIYPLSCVRGEVPERSIWKTGGVVVKKQ